MNGKMLIILYFTGVDKHPVTVGCYKLNHTAKFATN